MAQQFSPDIPIYLQIMEIYCDRILRGELARGDQLPSVRDVALTYRVNPNTVQKAFVEMDRMELTKSERTSGRFVIATDHLIRELRHERAKSSLDEFILRMQSLGIGLEEVTEMLEKGWKNEADR